MATILKRQEGQSVVEFALVLPLLALILMSILQFGILFNNYLTLTDAVRAGARKAAVSRLDVNRNDDVIATVQNAATALNKADLNVTVDSPSWGPGDKVTVKGSYKCDLTILGIDLKPDCHITSETTERVE